MMTSYVVSFACVVLLMASAFHADQELHSSSGGSSVDSSASATAAEAKDAERLQERERRPFDRIGGSMGAFRQRRAFDRIGAAGLSGLGGLQTKRRFDRIGSSTSSLGVFGKRLDDGSVDAAALDLQSSDDDVDQQRMMFLGDDDVSRSFDEVDLDKRAFDRIGSFSSLGGLQKRPFDRIGGLSSLGGLQKRAFDRIGSFGSLGGAGLAAKRPFDRIGSMSSMTGQLRTKRAATDGRS